MPGTIPSISLPPRPSGDLQTHHSCPAVSTVCPRSKLLGTEPFSVFRGSLAALGKGGLAQTQAAGCWAEGQLGKFKQLQPRVRHWDPGTPLPEHTGSSQGCRAEQLQQRVGRSGWPSTLGLLISSTNVRCGRLALSFSRDAWSQAVRPLSGSRGAVAPAAMQGLVPTAGQH